MKYSIKEWGKGLNLDALASEMEPGYCSGATSNIRFRNGFAERVRGIGERQANLGTSAYWMQVYPNDEPADGCFLAYGATQRAYAWDFLTTVFHSGISIPAAHAEITPYTDGVTISSITRVGTTATLTTASAHGRSTGDTLSIWGALPTQYNGTYRVTVTGATTFTYTMTSDPGASASPVGLYSYNGSTAGVAISSITSTSTTATLTTSTPHGRSSKDIITITGAVPAEYNGTVFIEVTSATTFDYMTTTVPALGTATTVGTYVYNGASQVFTNAFLATPQYSGGEFNGILLLNSRFDGLYYWNGDRSTRLRKVPGAGRARIARPFGNYVVQLAPFVGVVEYPRRVAWSAATDPGSIPSSFTASATNDAGNEELAAGGELIDCLPLGDTNIIYTADARYSMRHVGGQSIFSFERLPGTAGILCPGAVVDTPVGHVFLSKSREVMLHTGGECRNLSTGRVNSLLQTIVDDTTPFVVKSPSTSEVWVCIATTGRGTRPDTVLMWNWQDDTWGRKDIASHDLTCGTSGVPGTSGPPESLYIGVSDSFIGRAESADKDFGDANPVTATLERTGLDCGDSDVVKNLQRSRWNFDGIAGSVFTVYHGSSMTADGTPTYAASSSYTLGTTDYTNARAKGGRFLALKVTWNYADSSAFPVLGKIRSCDLDLTAGGKR